MTSDGGAEHHDPAWTSKGRRSVDQQESTQPGPGRLPAYAQAWREALDIADAYRSRLQTAVWPRSTLVSVFPKPPGSPGSAESRATAGCGAVSRNQGANQREATSGQRRLVWDRTCQTLIVRLGDLDGHGRYGIVDEGPDGCLCAECGWRGAHLGVHAYRAHGLTAAEYKQRHGLRRSRGLVASATRDAIRANAEAQYPSRTKLHIMRNPAAATAARQRLALPVAAAAADERDRRMAELARSARLGTVVICGYCRVEFCPLASAKRRRFCSRSCASKYNRRSG